MKAMNDLIDALKARLPGVHLRTLEEPRAIECLRQAVHALSGRLVPRQLWAWSSAGGLQRLPLDEEDPVLPIQETGPLDEALGAFKKSSDNVVLALLDPWSELENPFFARALREALAHARGSGKALVLVGRDWRVPPELQGDICIVDLPLPTRAELQSYIQSLATLYGEKLADKVAIDEASIPGLARVCQGLTLEETKSVTALSLVRYRAIGSEAIQMANREKRQIVARGGLLDFEDPVRSMADVGGLEHLKLWVRKRDALFSDSAREAGIYPPKGLLLVGVPGSGKTLAARAIAASWNLPLLKLESGRLFGSLVGESEANLRSALRTAEAIAPAVLMIDEMEKAFAPSGGHDGGTSARVFGALLSWLQDKQADVFVVATANDVSKLPPELLRKGRFDQIFAVDLPGFEARMEIIRIHLSRAGHRFKQGDLEAMARGAQGYTGAELEAAVQDALIDSYYDRGRKPKSDDVIRAIRESVPLSKTMAEKIDGIREWCRSGRAKQAGTGLEQDAVRKEVAVDL